MTLRKLLWLFGHQLVIFFLRFYFCIFSTFKVLPPRSGQGSQERLKYIRDHRRFHSHVWPQTAIKTISSKYKLQWNWEERRMGSEGGEHLFYNIWGAIIRKRLFQPLLQGQKGNGWHLWGNRSQATRRYFLTNGIVLWGGWLPWALTAASLGTFEHRLNATCRLILKKIPAWNRKSPVSIQECQLEHFYRS